MSVTSLQTKQGVILLQSSDASIGIATSGNNINLIASKTGSQGGVTSLNTLTGACILTSLGNTIGITEAVPFPGGHTINLEAIGGGGGSGIGTLNLQAPIAGNMIISGSGSVSVSAGATSNQIVITGTDVSGVPSVQQNSGTIITGAVQLASGTNITMSDNGVGAITINAVGDGAGIETINGQPPSAVGDFLIQSGNGGITVQSQTAGAIQIENTGVLEAHISIAGVPQPPSFTGSVSFTAGNNITLADNNANGFLISAVGDGAGIETINGVSPLAGNFTLQGGSGIFIDNSQPANGTQIDNTGVLSVVTGANTPVVGAITLVQGTNVSITEAGGSFTINATGDGAGIETINGQSPLLGEFTIQGGSGIFIDNTEPNEITIDNTGVLSVVTGANTPATGAITLVQGTNVTITEAGGSFTINATGGGAGIQSINTVAPTILGEFTIQGGSGIFIDNSQPANGIQIDNIGVLTISGISPTALGEWTLDNGTGIGYTQLLAPQAGIQLTNSGILSVTGGGNTYTGAISLIAGSGISITNPSAQQFEISNSGSGGVPVYANAVSIPLTINPASFSIGGLPPVLIVCSSVFDREYTYVPGFLGLNVVTTIPITTAVTLLFNLTVDATTTFPPSFCVTATQFTGGVYTPVQCVATTNNVSAGVANCEIFFTTTVALPGSGVSEVIIQIAPMIFIPAP